MDSTAIIDVLTRALPGDPARFEGVVSADGMPTLYVAAGDLVATAAASCATTPSCASSS